MKTHGKDMDRREFLRGLGTTAAGAGQFPSRQAATGEVMWAALSLEPPKVTAAPPFFTV
jgi:hypothetical protein